MPVVRFHPTRTAEIQGTEVPMIHPDDPKSKQVQEIWTAHVRLFDLSDDKQIKEYEQVWQEICDGRSKFADQQGPEWDATKGRHVALLRWASLSYKVGK